MDQISYEKLSLELQQLSKTIPLQWGKIQNNFTDNKINMFSCESLSTLEEEIKNLSLENQNYFKRRWFIWKCSTIDEYLFYKENNVRKNPNGKDKSWDIEFNKNITFDIKGTVVPKKLREQFNSNSEKKLINFYYKNQSKGVRFYEQNRLYIVHHSYYKSSRSMFLRCHWELKKEAYKYFNQKLTQNRIQFINFNKVIAKCIFIIETNNNDFYFKIN